MRAQNDGRLSLFEHERKLFSEKSKINRKMMSTFPGKKQQLLWRDVFLRFRLARCTMLPKRSIVVVRVTTFACLTVASIPLFAQKRSEFPEGASVQSGIIRFVNTFRFEDKAPAQKKVPPKQWKEKYSVYHKSIVDAVAFSPDDKLFATGSGSAIDEFIRLWDTASGKKLAEIKGGGPLKFTPDGNFLAFGSVDNKIIFWDVKEKVEKKAITGLSHVYGIDITRDGKKLAACDDDAMILWDLTTGQRLLKHSETGKKFHSVAFSPDGSLLALGSGHPESRTDPGEISLWKVPDKKIIRRFPTASGQINDVAFSPDGTTLAAGGVSNQKFGPPKGGPFLWNLDRQEIYVDSRTWE